MAENLNYAAEGSKCSNDDPANCNKYGRLYRQKNGGEACPDGWKLPSVDEWDVLETAVGGSAAKLKATSGWPTYTYECEEYGCEEESRNYNGTNESGFSALPSDDNANQGCWWTGSSKGVLQNPNTYYYAYYFPYRCIDSYTANVIQKSDVGGGEGAYFAGGQSLLSVRCVKKD